MYVKLGGTAHMAYGTKMAWVMPRAKDWIRTRGSSARSHQLGSMNFGHSLGAKTLGPGKVHSWALNMGCHQQTLGAGKEIGTTIIGPVTGEPQI